MRYHFAPIRMATIFKKEKKKKITRADKAVEKLEPSCTVRGNAEWCSQ